LFLIWCFFIVQAGWSQSRECVLPDCSELFVEIVRVHDNVLTDCALNDTNTLAGDQFYQMFYKVYLKYNDEYPDTLNDNPPVNLDYQKLGVKVNLRKLSGNSGGIQHSFINVEDTEDFYKAHVNGNMWESYVPTDPDEAADKVKFEVEPYSASISFTNYGSGDECGGTSTGGGSTQIPMLYETPDRVWVNCPGLYHACAYAELFTVVVNAWPGETIRFEIDTSFLEYIQSNGESVCEDDPLIRIVTSESNNALYGGDPIDAADTYASTENEKLQLLATGPSSGTNDRTFDLKLVNASVHDFSVNTLDFYVKVSLKNYDEPLTFSGTYAPAEIIDLGPDPYNTYHNATLLHYIVTDTWALTNSTTVTLSTIHVADPTLSNKSWCVRVKPEGGRIRTTYTSGGTYAVCTTLDVAGEPYDCPSGTPACTSSEVLFNIEKDLGGDCTSDFKDKVGLLSTVDIDTDVRLIRHFSFDLIFDLDPDVAISGVDVSEWGNSDSTGGCLGSSPLVTYQISGDTFRYCFTTTNMGALSFNLDPFDYMTLSFSHTGNGCVKSIKITKLLLQFKDESACIPPVNNPIDPLNQSINLSICGPNVGGHLLTEINDGVEDVSVKITASTTMCASCPGMGGLGACPPDSVFSTKAGAYGFCDLCASCDIFLVTPTKDDNPLNGVTTLDLVAISKHILALEPLTSPYKIIAADANHNGSVTTFDIVEIRKLILGIYSELPSNTSWRFIDASFTFGHPNNPFLDAPFPEIIDCVDPSDPKSVEFIAIKVGDVNNTAIAHSRPAARPIIPISWSNASAKPGETVFTVPVIYTGNEPLEAVQLGIHFDPTKFALVGPSKGELPGYTAANFGLTRLQEGEIRTLWFPTDEFEKIQPGATLFYLSFQVLDGAYGADFALELDDNILYNAAWKPDGTECAVSATPDAMNRNASPQANASSILQASVQPNPSAGAVHFIVTAKQAMKGRIDLYDAFGNRLLLRNVDFSAGEQVIPLPEIDKQPAGIYLWKVYSKDAQVQGRLIKQ